MKIVLTIIALFVIALALSCAFLSPEIRYAPDYKYIIGLCIVIAILGAIAVVGEIWLLPILF